MARTSTFKIIGITDDSHVCECCGKKNLKRVVVLEHIDTGNIVRYGTNCAIKSLGVKQEGIDLEIELRAKVQKMREHGFGLVAIRDYLPRSWQARIENDVLWVKGINTPIAKAAYLSKD